MQLQNLAVLALCALAPAAAQSSPPKRPRITGVAHIALFVHDMDQARRFYKDFLGLGEPFTLPKPEGDGLAMSFIKVNDRQYIEIFPETQAQTDRLNHISVETDDIEAMRLYLAAKGYQVPAKPNLGRIKNLSFTVKDPDGHGVEFVQYMPDGWSMREKGKFLPERVSTKMLHVGIIVNALEPAMKFYRDVLGFQEIWRGSRDGKVLSWVNMKVPDGDTYIEFMLHDPLPAATARGSAHHICLETPDIEKSKAWLLARPSVSEYKRPLEIRTGINRKRQLNLFDPDGTRTELMEPATVDGVPAPSATAPPPK